MSLRQVQEADTVAVCRGDILAGEQVPLGSHVVQIRADTPRGHMRL
jgi:hypothetical protein